MKPHFLLILLIGWCLSSAYGQSPYPSLQVPKQIQYQGRVATGTGSAWSGTEGYFSFALVQGSTVLWNNWEGTASPSDPGAVSLGAGQVLTMPVNQGVFSVRLGEGSDINEQIPPTVFFDTVANSVRTGVKLAVWFSPDGGTFTRLSPDVDFSSVPYSMVSGIAEAVKERAVTTAMLADAAVTGSKIAPSTIDSSQLAAGGVTGSDIAPGTILASHLDSSFAQDVLNPAGSVIAFAGDVPPAGWLLCDGSQISRGTYARLFAAIGTAHGSGDGATTFHLPDYRGRFLRGVDGLAGRDPDKSSRTAMASGGNTGNLMGTVQNDEIKSHGHSASFTTGNSSADQAGDGNQRPPVRTNPNYNTPRDWGVSVGSTGGSESRPKNANVNYIIKL